MEWYAIEIEAEIVQFYDAPDSEKNATGITNYVAGRESVWEIYEENTDSIERAKEIALDKFKKEYLTEDKEIMDGSLVIDSYAIEITAD